MYLPEVIEAISHWREHYAASTSQQQLKLRSDHLNVLTRQYHPFELSPAEAASIFIKLGETASPQHMADKISSAMNGATMTKEDILICVKEAGIQASRQQIETSLRNRKVFECIPPPGKHYRGTYRVLKSPEAIFLPKQ